MEHRGLVALRASELVNDVKRKVEFVLVFERHRLEHSLRSFLEIGELRINSLLRVRFLGSGLENLADTVGHYLAFVGRVENYRIKHAVPSVHRDHSVRRGAVVIDRITFGKDLGMLADLHLELSGHYNVAFLSGVGRKLDRLCLRRRVISAGDVERLRDPAAERGREVVVHHSVRLLDTLSLTAPRHRIGAQLRAGALDYIGNIHSECGRCAVDKRKRQIVRTGFAFPVLILGNVGTLCHLGDAHSDDLPQLAYTRRHLHDLGVKSVHMFHKCFLPFPLPVVRVGALRRSRKKLFLSRGGKTKARPKDRIIFETSCKSITRGTTQIAPLGRLSSDSAKPYALTQQSREGSTCLIRLSSFRLGSYRYGNRFTGFHLPPAL